MLPDLAGGPYTSCVSLFGVAIAFALIVYIFVGRKSRSQRVRRRYDNGKRPK